MEKSTYFAYNEGIDPSILRIGSMVFDFANPKTKRPYRHGETITGIPGDPLLATHDTRLNCTLAIESGSSHAFDIGLEGILGLGLSRSRSFSRLVVGGNGSKVELIEPDVFFRDHVLADPQAKLWLAVSTSVSSRMEEIRKNWFGSPTIWLLTGIYLIDDAKVCQVESRSAQHSATANAPLLDPTGIAALTGLSLGGSVELGSSHKATAGTHISGRKVWAAQWIKVKAKFYRKDPSSMDQQLPLNDIKLLDVTGTSARRGGEKRVDHVELSLEAHDGHDHNDEASGEAAPEDVEKMWADFEMLHDQVMDDVL